ncbi:hypothetical protein C8R45DRAFT_758808, partial [Mycena sanguinolenta]
LRLMGVPHELTDWLVRRYAGRTSRIVFDDYTSDPFVVDGGLDQGDPISGIAYLLYNSDVIQRPGGVDEWAAQHNAIFGPAKYQLLDASRKRKPHWAQRHRTVPLERKSMQLGTHTIKSAKVVKLLGLHLDRELRWKEQGASALAKGQGWLSQVGRLARSSRGIKAGPMRRLYLSTCVPRMLYGADVFLNAITPKSRGSPKRAILGRLVSVQRRAALLITGALASSPGDALDAYANLLPM